MNRTLNRYIAILISFALVFSSFCFASVSYAAADTEGPTVDLDSLSISTHTITDPHEKPTVKIKVTDESGVVYVNFYYTFTKTHSVATAMLEYNEDTGFFEGEVQYDGEVGYYGEYQLWQIQTADAYGNHVFLEDLGHVNGDFEIVGGNPDDKDPPIIDCDHIVVDKIVSSGKTATMTIPIADDSVVLNAWVLYRSPKGDVINGFFSHKGDGIYQTELIFENEGEYHLDCIYATDANYNYMYIRNTDIFEPTYNEYDEGERKALGNLNVQYGQEVQTEVTASIKSMELSNGMFNRNTEETLTVTFDASVSLKSAWLNYDFRRGTTQTMYNIEGTKINDYTFSFVLPSVYYGLYPLVNVGVTDLYGNRVSFYDPTQPDVIAEGVSADLSGGNYYVGIVDPETGLGVSDTEFDNTTDLLVDEESLNSELCEDMVEDDSIPVAMYDVEVEGSRDDETAVSFVAPEGFVDGDVVEVVHQRHDGTNETFEAEVKHGRITIETDEFSPFLIQVDEEHEHREVVKEAVPATCTKAGLTEGKYCAFCGEVFVEQKKTKAKGHKYSTTYMVDKPASATKNGSKSQHCKNCDAKRNIKTIYKLSTAKIGKTTFVYDGKAKNPKLILKDSKGNTISSKNYAVTKTKGRTKVGTYSYKVTFKGDYKGIKAKKFTFKINPKATSITAKPTAAKKSFTVKWKKVSKQATGYQVMYSTNKNFTKKTSKTVNIKSYKTISKKVTGLKAKQKYYVKVRTYKTVNGTKYYSNWSTAKSVITKK